uniref:Hepcidin n=1 Tax=Hucho hucho TaxID=62062 RepID=A0A4W5LWR7_9TELE
MKVFSVAVAVDLTCMLIMTHLCIISLQEQTDEVGSIDSPVGEHQQPGGVSLRPPEHFRFKRQSHLSLCRWCCNCCHNKGCGFCCKF